MGGIRKKKQRVLGLSKPGGGVLVGPGPGYVSIHVADVAEPDRLTTLRVPDADVEDLIAAIRRYRPAEG